MDTQKIYHVTSFGSGWKAMLENGGRASVTGENKLDVIKRTIAMAKHHTMSIVIVHKADGSIQEQFTYPKSHPHYLPVG